MDLKALLAPKKIAIIGASEKEGFGGATCRNAIENMKEGDYYFINPKRPEVLGKKCYPSLASLPEKVDLVVICTPKSTVEGLLRESAESGVKGAVLFASGYGEVGTDEGRQAEESLVALCHELDIALMGPNCAGYVNFVNETWPFAFIADKWDRRGGVGIISQSGQLALSMMDNPKPKFSYAISAGNATVCTMEDYLEYLVDDADTKVIALYMEGVKDPGRFVQVLKKAAEKRKPIVAIKTGRSDKGQIIASSHTGSMSGSDKVYDALFEKFGVIRVDDLEELMSTAQALATFKNLPAKPTFASMNLSGGETGICADLGQTYEIDFPDFDEDTLEKLRKILPSYATPNNPLDMTASLSYDVDLYATALETVMRDPNIGLVAIGYTLLQNIADPAIHFMAKAIERVCAQPDSKPVVMIPFCENTRNDEYYTKLEKAGVPILPPSLYAFKILNHIAKFAAYRPEDHDFNIVIPIPKALGIGSLSETQSKEDLAKWDMPFPKVEVVKTAEEARIVADSIGYPIVVKIDSPDILHKSDIGCVQLNLNSADEVYEATKLVFKNANEKAPNSNILGAQICQMVKPGTEMIIGVNNDPQFGPCVLCGLGGVFVEVFKDVSLCIAPVSRFEADKMVSSLKGKKLLDGYRGFPKADVESFVDTIIKVSKYSCENRDTLLEMDLNPVFVYESGVCAVDALVVKR